MAKLVVASSFVKLLAPYQAVCSFFSRSTAPDNALLSENVSNTGGVVAGVEFATSEVALEEFAGELGIVGILTKRKAEAIAIFDFFESNFVADKVLAFLPEDSLLLYSL
ncbi:hypothetical protein [Microcoleus sp. N9_B4]|uniref:hypothetical protein n=1 Tax=Microcoleus sp. N9_B4 TaxID=3055386 RepID=UPI004040AFA4